MVALSKSAEVIKADYQTNFGQGQSEGTRWVTNKGQVLIYRW